MCHVGFSVSVCLCVCVCVYVCACNNNNNNNNERISRAPFNKNMKHMHIYKTLKTVGVQVIMLKHPTKHKKEYP